MNHIYLEGGNKNVSFFTWMNQDLHNLDSIAEVDVGISYIHNIKLGQTKKGNDINLTLSPNFAYFTFPNSTFPDCKLLGLTASASGLPITPKIDAKKGFGSSKGYFVNTSIGKDIPINQKVNLNATIELEFNDKFFSTGTGFIYSGASGSISYTPSPNFELKGIATYQQALNKKHLDARTEGMLRLVATYIFK
ncbi:MAG: hypothetical protein WC758_01265 [Candidatus Woesearchaeota archaeon]|jgi:hypothetical protein